MDKNIVIVGANYAGVLTAKKLAKRLKKAELHIILIDKHPYHTMLTELHEVAANRVPEDHVRISLKKISAGGRVDVVLDTVTSVDYDSKTVIGRAGSYSYDYLVVASGSKPNYFGTPGAEEYSYKLWSFDDAVRLKHLIVDVFNDFCLSEREYFRIIRGKTAALFEACFYACFLFSDEPETQKDKYVKIGNNIGIIFQSLYGKTLTLLKSLYLSFDKNQLLTMLLHKAAGMDA
jgi:pyruvate/2-oxoglutarate dehydrogenase complex dihydrolipoamide dehydrogenase (E3) component